jgi:predicted Zn-dependent protease
MQRGQSYFSQGDFVKASIEFRNALQIQPKNPNAAVMAGEAAEKLGKVRDAAGLYQSVIDSAPDNAAARANLGRLYLYSGAPDRALSLVEPGLARHPDDAPLLLVRAAVRAQTNNATGAREDAEHALRMAPDSEDAVGLLAGLYQQAGENDKAIALISDALGRMPTSVDLRQVLASLYVSTAQPARAEEQLRKIIELRPHVLTYRYELARYYVNTQRLDDAQRVLEQAVQVESRSDQAKLALADFMTVQRSPAAGEKTLRGFIARQPDNDALKIGLGELLHRSGALQSALLTFEEVAKRDATGPSGLTARDQMAVIKVEQGEYDAALQLIGEVLKANPRDNAALVQRATIELVRKEPAAAITDLRAVLRDQPNAISVRRLLASAFVDNGEPALAEEQLRVALQAAPGDTWVRLDLARVLGQTGRASAAVALLEESIRGAPTNAALREALVRAEIASSDFAAARKALADLGTLDSGSATVPLLAGEIAQASGQLAEATRDYEQALKLQPRNVEPLAALVKVEVAMNESGEAVARVRATVAADPHNALRQNLLAETLIAAKAYPEAISTLTTLIKTTPNWSLPYHNLAVAHVLAGEQAAATSAYEAGLKAVPFDPDLTYELAGMYERQGRAADAIARCEALYVHSPHQARAASNLALLLVDHRTDQRSLDRARDLTAPFAASNDPVLLDAYGWVRYKRGETDPALTALERAVQAAPHAATTRYHLAMTQLKAGETAKARTNLEAALAAGSNFRGRTDAQLALASLPPTRTGG